MSITKQKQQEGSNKGGTNQQKERKLPALNSGQTQFQREATKKHFKRDRKEGGGDSCQRSAANELNVEDEVRIGRDTLRTLAAIPASRRNVQASALTHHHASDTLVKPAHHLVKANPEI